MSFNLSLIWTLLLLCFHPKGNIRTSLINVTLSIGSSVTGRMAISAKQVEGYLFDEIEEESSNDGVSDNNGMGLGVARLRHDDIDDVDTSDEEKEASRVQKKMKRDDRWSKLI